jgi:hypothetical protein
MCYGVFESAWTLDCPYKPVQIQQFDIDITVLITSKLCFLLLLYHSCFLAR